MGTMGFSHESDAYEIRHAVQVAQVRRDNLLYET
jgi:hypothetical protein